MNWIVTVTAASFSGWLWATIFVDFVPSWYEAIPPVLAVLLLLTPLAIGFLCAFGLESWSKWNCIGYCAIVMAWAIVGWMANENRNAGNLSHIIWPIIFAVDAMRAGLLVASCLAGRRLRERLHHRRNPDPD
jgi:predicted histidine transporter YuiF (NhaC family)